MSIEIYVGFDESNHAGTGEIGKKGEIVVGVFSFNKKYNLPACQKNRREPTSVYPLLCSEIEYRFTILTGDDFKYSSSASNLSIASIPLIESFIKTHNLSTKFLKLYLNFDGFFGKNEKNLLKNYFKDLESFVIKNYIKKQKTKCGKLAKSIYTPSLIYFADIIANDLLTEPLQSLLSNPFYVPFYNPQKETQDL